MKNILFIFLLFLTISCTTTKYVEVEKEVPIIENRVEYRDKLVYDSIYMKDSIYTLIKEDTIYVYKEKTNTRYIYKTDTLIKVDSIPYPVKIKETIVKESKQFNWWQNLIIFIIAFAIVKLITKVVKVKIKIKTKFIKL